MREIKFRAWNKLKKEMWHGFYVQSDTGNVWLDTEDGIEQEFTSESFDLMQFTGLKDRNGKEIYEGDLVKCWIDQTFDSVEKVGVIVYEAPAFMVDFPEHGTTLGINEEYEMEIVGNEHENPELLK